MEVFFSKFSFMQQLMVKILFLVLKRKRKINYNEVRKKVVDWEGGENIHGYVQRNEKWVIKEVVDCGVLN